MRRVSEESPRPGVKVVLFDFGGVITTSPLEAFAAYERERGLPHGTIRRINSTNPDANAWARYERREVDEPGFVALFEAEAAALGAGVDAREVLGLLHGDLRPAMLSALHRLHAAGLRLALLTNNVAPIERPGPLDDLLGLFDVVVESSIEGVRKPEPAFYERALERLGGVAAHEAVFLDDLGVNLKPARALGMATVKVTDPAEALRELSALVGVDLSDEPAQPTV
jgi:putative hydrolase of the HAD superfamily